MTSSKAIRMIVIQVLAGIIICATASSSASVADERQQQPVVWSLDKEQPIHVDGRASSFIRIGKSRPSSTAAAEADVAEILESLGVDRLNGNDNYENKRASSFVRIGKSLADERELPSSLEADDYQMKRASSFVRIGRQPHQSSASLSSLSSAPRKSDDFGRKRMSSFVRIGKRHQIDNDEILDDSKMLPILSTSETEVEAAGVGRPNSAAQISSTACNNVLGGAQRCKPVVSENDSEAIPDKKASSFIRIGRSVNNK